MCKCACPSRIPSVSYFHMEHSYSQMILGKLLMLDKKENVVTFIQMLRRNRYLNDFYWKCLWTGRGRCILTVICRVACTYMFTFNIVRRIRLLFIFLSVYQLVSEIQRARTYFGLNSTTEFVIKFKCICGKVLKHDVMCTSYNNNNKYQQKVKLN